MKLLITGGGGFVGTRLARTLLTRGTLAGRTIGALVLADQIEPPAGLLADPRVSARVGPLLDQCTALAGESFDGVFHLASAVSGECEADFDLGMRSNLDSTRALLDALRAHQQRHGQVSRLVFSSSVAVFGPDASVPLPPQVAVDTLPAPLTSYGMQKLVCEHMLADFTRKGFVDGRAARLMTVTVRPGRPNGAASSFFSGIIREPLQGLEALLPVEDSVLFTHASPRSAVGFLIHAAGLGREQLGPRVNLSMPGVCVTVGEQIEALRRIAGDKAVKLIRRAPDKASADIVKGWPTRFDARRALALGFKAEQDFDEIIRVHIEDDLGGRLPN